MAAQVIHTPLTLLTPMRTFAPRQRVTTAPDRFEDIPLDTLPPRAYQSRLHTHDTMLLQPLPRRFAVRVYDARAFRRHAGEVQIAQAHAAYKDTWAGAFLGARAPIFADHDAVAESRMAANAGAALVQLSAQGLVTLGIAKTTADATRILSALRKGGVVDSSNRVSRGAEFDVAQQEITDATRGLRLSQDQDAMLRDAIEVVKFFYDFGIRPARDAFGVELCCGASAFARSSSWREWGYTMRHLFDPEPSAKTERLLKERLAKLRA